MTLFSALLVGALLCAYPSITDAVDPSSSPPPRIQDQSLPASEVAAVQATVDFLAASGGTSESWIPVNKVCDRTLSLIIRKTNLFAQVTFTCGNRSSETALVASEVTEAISATDMIANNHTMIPSPPPHPAAPYQLKTIIGFRADSINNGSAVTFKDVFQHILRGLPSLRTVVYTKGTASDALGVGGNCLGLPSNLAWIDFSGNTLRGSLAAECAEKWTQGGQLQRLDLSGNRLAGDPQRAFDIFGKQPLLSYISLGGNVFDRANMDMIAAAYGPGDISRDLLLPGCGIVGTLRGVVDTGAQYGILDLSGNFLRAYIPQSFFSSQNNTLRQLNLANNGLVGPLPSDWASAANLWKLDLSGNNLSGTVPPVAGSLAALKSLRLDGNQLSGPMPTSFDTVLSGKQLEECRLSPQQDFLGANRPTCSSICCPKTFSPAAAKTSVCKTTCGLHECGTAMCSPAPPNSGKYTLSPKEDAILQWVLACLGWDADNFRRTVGLGVIVGQPIPICDASVGKPYLNSKGVLACRSGSTVHIVGFYVKADARIPPPANGATADMPYLQFVEIHIAESVATVPQLQLVPQLPLRYLRLVAPGVTDGTAARLIIGVLQSVRDGMVVDLVYFEGNPAEMFSFSHLPAQRWSALVKNVTVVGARVSLLRVVGDSGGGASQLLFPPVQEWLSLRDVQLDVSISRIGWVPRADGKLLPRNVDLRGTGVHGELPAVWWELSATQYCLLAPDTRVCVPDDAKPLACIQSEADMSPGGTIGTATVRACSALPPSAASPSSNTPVVVIEPAPPAGLPAWAVVLAVLWTLIMCAGAVLSYVRFRARRTERQALAAFASAFPGPSGNMPVSTLGGGGGGGDDDDFDDKSAGPNTPLLGGGGTGGKRRAGLGAASAAFELVSAVDLLSEGPTSPRSGVPAASPTASESSSDHTSASKPKRSPTPSKTSGKKSSRGAGRVRARTRQALAPFVIDASDLEVGDVIGRGSFGCVLAGTWRHTPVAIKEAFSSNRKLSSAQVTEVTEIFKREARHMATLRPHPNVVSFFGVLLEPRLAIVLRLCEGGSLFDYLHGRNTTAPARQRPLDGQRGLKLIRGIARGVDHIHREGIVHRDLAARNVLLDERVAPLVSDFGSSASLKERARAQGKGAAPPAPARGVSVASARRDSLVQREVGPIKWMAPELMRSSDQWSVHSDVWSFGVVCFEVMVCKLPWEDHDVADVMHRVLGGERLELNRHTALHTYPRWLFEIVRRCWAMTPGDRPTMGEIVKRMSHEIKSHKERVAASATTTAAAPTTSSSANGDTTSPDATATAPSDGSSVRPPSVGGEMLSPRRSLTLGDGYTTVPRAESATSAGGSVRGAADTVLSGMRDSKLDMLLANIDADSLSGGRPRGETTYVDTSAENQRAAPGVYSSTTELADQTTSTSEYTTSETLLGRMAAPEGDYATSDALVGRLGGGEGEYATSDALAGRVGSGEGEYATSDALAGRVGSGEGEYATSDALAGRIASPRKSNNDVYSDYARLFAARPLLDMESGDNTSDGSRGSLRATRLNSNDDEE